MLILAILFTFGGGGVKPTKPRGSIMGMQGNDGSITELGGMMKVAMLDFDIAWVKFVVLVLGNEVGGPHHMQGHHTQVP